MADDEGLDFYSDLVFPENHFKGILQEETVSTVEVAATGDDKGVGVSAKSAGDASRSTSGAPEVKDIDESDDSSSDEGDSGDIQIIIGDASAAKAKRPNMRLKKNTWRRSSLQIAQPDLTEAKATGAEDAPEAKDGKEAATEPGTTAEAQGADGTTKSKPPPVSTVGKSAAKPQAVVIKKVELWTSKTGFDEPPGGYDARFMVEPFRMKTAFDIDIELIPQEERGWLVEGADLTDYFNFGHDEKGWLEYAARQLKVRKNKLYEGWLVKRQELDEFQEKERVRMQAERADKLADGGAASMAAANPSRFVEVSQRKCFKCQQFGHMASVCPNVRGPNSPGPGTFSEMPDRICYKCGERGHMASSCPNSETRCFQCNEPGHTAKNCPKQRCFRCQQYGHQASACPNPPSAPPPRGGGGRDRYDNRGGRDDFRRRPDGGRGGRGDYRDNYDHPPARGSRGGWGDRREPRGSDRRRSRSRSPPDRGRGERSRSRSNYRRR